MVTTWLWLTQAGTYLFSHFPGGIKEMGSPVWWPKVENFLEQNCLNWLQMAQLECPRHWIPNAALNLKSHSGWESSIFTFSWKIKAIWKWTPQYENQRLKIFSKVENFLKQNWLESMHMVQLSTESIVSHSGWNKLDFSYPGKWNELPNRKTSRTKLSRQAANGPISYRLVDIT